MAVRCSKLLPMDLSTLRALQGLAVSGQTAHSILYVCGKLACRTSAVRVTVAVTERSQLLLLGVLSVSPGSVYVDLLVRLTPAHQGMGWTGVSQGSCPVQANNMPQGQPRFVCVKKLFFVAFAAGAKCICFEGPSGCGRVQHNKRAFCGGMSLCTGVVPAWCVRCELVGLQVC